MIYTSYFAKYKGENGVAIAAGATWWRGQTYKQLAPTLELLRWWKSLTVITDLEIQKYIDIYYNTVLAKLDVNQVAKDLSGKVLLCFEKSDSFCHRHIVAKWLNSTGYPCKELDQAAENS